MYPYIKSTLKSVNHCSPMQTSKPFNQTPGWPTMVQNAKIIHSTKPKGSLSLSVSGAGLSHSSPDSSALPGYEDKSCHTCREES